STWGELVVEERRGSAGRTWPAPAARGKCLIQVLPPAGGIDTGRLELRPRARRDPDVLPRRRDHERADPLELLLVLDRGTHDVHVTETPARSPAPPTPPPRHRLPLVSATVQIKTIVVLEGDETGQELLEESLRVLAPDVIGLELEFPRFDLSLEARRET